MCSLMMTKNWRMTSGAQKVNWAQVAAAAAEVCVGAGVQMRLISTNLTRVCCAVLCCVCDGACAEDEVGASGTDGGVRGRGRSDAIDFNGLDEGIVYVMCLFER